MIKKAVAKKKKEKRKVQISSSQVVILPGEKDVFPGIIRYQCKYCTAKFGTSSLHTSHESGCDKNPKNK